MPDFDDRQESFPTTVNIYEVDESTLLESESETTDFDHLLKYERWNDVGEQHPLLRGKQAKISTQQLHGFFSASADASDCLSEARTQVNEFAWLDGLRGWAASAVFMCHLCFGTWDVTHSYGAGESGENNHLLQLPILRLLYSGPPMVSLFFVISGYALSIKPFRQMQRRQPDKVFQTMTSAILRRAVRLFLPCMVATLLVALSAQLGLYDWTRKYAESMRVGKEEHVKANVSFVQQVFDWASESVKTIDVFDWSIYTQTIYLDRHLWTIPVEFRCSLALFLVHLLVARMKTLNRLSALSFLVGMAAYWDRCELVPFLSGALLAHLSLLTSIPDSLSCSRPGMNSPSADIHTRAHRAHYWVVFCVGLFLASFPDEDGHDSPGYKVLNGLIPESWTEKHRFWPNIGAIMIIWSVHNIDHLKSFLSSRLMLYLGNISFPLYATHGLVIHTFGYKAFEVAESFMGAYSDENRAQYVKGFILAAVATTVFAIVVADMFRKLVDERCIKFGKWMEREMLED